MIFLIVTSIFLLGISTYLGYRVWYLAGVVTDIQEQTENDLEYITMLELTNKYMYDRIKKSYDTMQQIDRLGAFESEDEAGTTFELLKQVINELKEEFDNAQSEEK